MLNVWLTFSVILVIAFIFEIINGFHDTANSIATTVSTRVLSLRNAIILAAALNFTGAYVSASLLPALFPKVFSHNVATTISSGLVNASEVPQHVILGALIAAIIWGLFTWRLGLPSSSSHALIGGLLGASMVDFASVGVVNWFGVWNKVILWLIASPIVGFVVAFLVMSLLFELLRKVSQYTANKRFSKLQIVSASLMAFAHGSNDAQKTMGIITMALISLNAGHSGALPQWMLPVANQVPVWVILSCAVVMALGTSLGGWRIIKTMGVNMIKLNPVGGFAAETSAAAVIEIASFNGIPLSTTHVISASIMGVGAAKRFSAVRWSVARNMVFAWVITIPATIVMGALIDLGLRWILQFI